jgi:threonine dehydrogenase-like Zn-dependent dehydrogenase
MPGFGHDGGTDFTVSGWYDITSKEIELRGCFAGDFRHLVEAIDFIDRSDWPFECLVTHRYTLDMANEALACVEQRRAIKAAIVY